VNIHIRPIQTKEDYDAMVALVDELIDAEPGSEDYNTLQIASDLVWAWEQKNVGIPAPGPIEAIKFRLEQSGMTLRDLRPYIGTDARVSEVISGKRELTLKMVRALHRHLGIPLESLVQERNVPIEEDPEIGKYPIPESMKLGYTGPYTDPKSGADEEAWLWLRKAGAADSFQFVLCRQNSASYMNAKTEPHALYLWCLHIRAEALSEKLPRSYSSDLIDNNFLTELARFSRFDDGPALAKEKLNQIGVHLIVAKHLRGTFLDGAAMLLPDGAPVIGMTLRHDRLDNFWHCLLHELAHIWLHLGKEGAPSFFQDDFDVAGDLDRMEKEADSFACDALLPDSAMEELGNLTFVSTGDVRDLAEKFQVHEAIVAGRIRYQTSNYSKFAKLLGYGEPKKVLGVTW
jgi:HTH-type transcriptional regulator/antitoxin HigA